MNWNLPQGQSRRRWMASMARMSRSTKEFGMIESESDTDEGDVKKVKKKEQKKNKISSKALFQISIIEI